MSLPSWRPNIQPVGRTTPAPDVVRALILDYLRHNGYASTARAFLRDSAIKHLDADGDEMMSEFTPPSQQDATDDSVLSETLEEDLIQTEHRREICARILSGNIEEAIALLERYFPNVLTPEDRVLREATHSTVSQPVLRYIPPTTVEPHHLRLNLHMQMFIEAARTVPLPYRSEMGEINTASPSYRPRRQRVSQLNPSERAADEPDVGLLKHAKDLISEAQMLPEPDDRSKFIVEIANGLCALLAYPIPEEIKEMQSYLSYERREGVANQIDNAILHRTNHLPISRLELIVRYTSTLFASPAEYGLDIKLPSSAQLLLAQDLQPWLDAVARPENPPTSPSVPKPSNNKDTVQVPFPRFDLKQFLDTGLQR